MNDALQKLLRLKAALKAAVTAGVFAVIVVIYYSMFYTSVADEMSGALSQRKTLGTEKESYEKRKKEYIAYREELRTLQEEQRELLKALPKRAEMPTFMANIQEQADLSGLEVMTLGMGAEDPEQDLYMKIPVSMDVRGSYHSLTRFFKNVSELRRIVNIENLSVSAERNAADVANPKIRAKFIAATFRYLDKGGS